MSDTVYRLWASGNNRFAVTPRQQAIPVLGYVKRNGDEYWKIERAGKILLTAYPSAADAARALIELAATRTT
jgi:hypothetical protein